MDPKTKILTHNNDSKRSIITPIYKTSTFVFDTAEDGEKIFKGQSKNFVYSRINHPNMITTEQKISIFDNSEESALFSSGMSAISTTMFSFLDGWRKDTKRKLHNLFYSTPFLATTAAPFSCQRHLFQLAIDKLDNYAEHVFKVSI